jgi:hypothetical protein
MSYFSQICVKYPYLLTFLLMKQYLNRDVKRGLIVTTSVDLQSVKMNLPNYIIKTCDSEAVANPSLVGTPRTPTVAYTTSGWQVNYSAATTTVVYSISGSSILRTENGVVTTIASSTDQLVPQSTDVELANTEYATTSVTFLPIHFRKRRRFTYGNKHVRDRVSAKQAPRLTTTPWILGDANLTTNGGARQRAAVCPLHNPGCFYHWRKCAP